MTPLRAIAGKLLIAATPLMPCSYGFAAPTFSSGIQTGTIQNAAVNEASGIAASRMNANVLWTHDDSGNPAQIFPMTPAGTNLGTYTITGASNVDWEDIAVGPGPTLGAQYVYIGDIGDNAAVRSNISVYRVPEPVVSELQPPTSISISSAAKFTFVYPDGPRDAESMFVDPLTRDIYIISKRENPKHLYRAAYPQSTSGTTSLGLMTEFLTDSTWLTAADISLDGNEIIARSTGDTSGRMYLRPPGGSITDAFNSAPITIPLRTEPQGEAIGFDANGWGYYTVSEGSGQPIYYFNRVLDGDYNQNKVVDAADYSLWRKTTGTQPAYDTWRSHFGQTSSSGGGSSATVPEPGSWMLLGIGVSLLWMGNAVLARRSRSGVSPIEESPWRKLGIGSFGETALRL